MDQQQPYSYPPPGGVAPAFPPPYGSAHEAYAGQQTYNAAAAAPPPISVPQVWSTLGPADSSSVLVIDAPLDIKIHTYHGKVATQPQVLKALLHAKSEEVAAILAAYLRSKSSNEDARLSRSYAIQSDPSTSSRPEVRMYNHLIHKLETLSAAVLSRKLVPRETWLPALGQVRYRIFQDLHSANEIVRCFSPPSTAQRMPVLDIWALGLGQSTWVRNPFKQSNFRPANFNASWELLSQVQTVFLVDDSGSMEASVGGGTDGYYRAVQSRWAAVGDLIAHVAPIITQHAPEGVSIYFLNCDRCYPNLRLAHDVTGVFQSVRPGGATYTGRRVNDILDGYLTTLRYDRSLKPLNLVVFTDGESTDEETLHWAIEEHVTKVVHRGYPPAQLGVEFCQVGDDRDATRHLLKLEEEVSRHHLAFNRDVVGVTPTVPGMVVNADQTLAILLSGVDARLSGYMRQRRVNV